MYRHTKLIFFLLLCIGSGLSAVAQNFTLRGRVLDPVGELPIEGAVVTISTTGQSVKTNATGDFTASVPSLTGDVTTWYPGFYTDLRPVAGQQELRIVLVPLSKKNYSSTVILPFRGVVSKQAKASSLQSVAKKDVSLPTTSADRSMSAMPGVQVMGKSGMPGEGNYFSIRGVNTLTASSQPLLVINGVPYMPDQNESGIIGGFSKGILNGIHPRDIENITVLKGAETALYGSMGSNGVVMIETDKAIDLETRVELISQVGVSSNQRRMPVMGVQDYKSYIGNVALTRYDDMAQVLNLFPYLIDDPDYYYNFLYNNSTDWQSLIYQPGLTTDHVLKIKGGDAIAKYDLSIGVKSDKGQLISTGYDKYFARLNSDVNLSRNIQFFSSVLMAYHSYTAQEQGMLGSTNPMLAAMKKGPVFSPWQKDNENRLLPDLAVIRDQDDRLIVNNSVSNPLAIVQSLDAREHGYDVQINAGINYKASDALNLKALAGIYYYLSRQNVFVPGITNRTIMPLSNGLATNTVRSAEGTTYNQYYQLGADYKKVFDGVHALDASINWNMLMNSMEYDAGTGYNTANDFYKTLNNVSSASRRYFGYHQVWNLWSTHARAQYVYDRQLSAGVSLTADASSASGPDAPQLQLYPALQLSWMAHNGALKGVSAINKLTLRGELFQTGNSRFSSSLSKYHYINKVFRELSGIVRAGIPNTEIVPERTTTLGVGADASLFGHRLDLTLDLYHSRNSNLIMPVSVSSAFGVNYLYDNVASTSNTGVEAGLELAVVRTRDFQWNVGVSIAANTEKVLSLGDQDDLILEMEDGSAIRTQVGQALYSFYGYQTKGVLKDATQAAGANGKGGTLTTFVGNAFQAGDVWFVDQNGDSKIDDRDRVNLGSASPQFYGYLTTSLSYKNVELSAGFNYSVGNSMYNAVRRSMESMSDFTNQLVTVNRRWMSDGQETDMPRAVFGDPMGNSRFSDRWIEDASFIRLKELTFSWHLENVLRGTTLFVTGENLLTLTNYLGMDPETMYSYDASMRGFDYAKVAHPITFKLGCNIQF